MRKALVAAAVAACGLALVVAGTGTPDDPRFSVDVPANATACAGSGGTRSILWGAYVDGDAYGLTDPPWDMRSLTRFEETAGKRAGILHWGEPWQQRGAARPFPRRQLEAAWARRVVPLVDWSPWDVSRNGDRPDQPDFSLQRIADGTHDALIRTWAREAARWGRPFLLRMAHEMNGDWYPWSERVNGNRPGEFIAAWRHVRRIFAAAGADNVSWVWAVNTAYPGSIPLRSLFPGRNQVDWVGVDVYNFGTNPGRDDRWRPFAPLLDPTYRQVRQLAPRTPIMITEFASTEFGGSKADWIAAALDQMPTRFPAVRAVSWFNWDAHGFDWRIESSSQATAAFRRGIAADTYANGAKGAGRGTGGVTPVGGC